MDDALIRSLITSELQELIEKETLIMWTKAWASWQELPNLVHLVCKIASITITST